MRSECKNSDSNCRKGTMRFSVLKLQLLILLTIILHTVHGFKDYHSCLDVKKDLGSQAVDGEYIIYLSSLNNVGISVYCHGKIIVFFISVFEIHHDNRVYKNAL